MTESPEREPEMNRGTQREKIGKRLRMQFSAFSYPFVAF